MTKEALQTPEPLLEITDENVRDYLRSQRLVDESDEVAVEELGGGISNVLLRFTTASDCGVLKQSRARIRVEQEWLCDVRRILNEQDSIRLLGPILPEGSVPAIRLSDDDNFLFVMACAPREARLWKTELMAGRIDPNVGAAVARLLRRIHDATRDDPRARERFDNEPLLWQLRIDPYYEATARANPDVQAFIDEGAERILRVKRTLVHGDYVPKNIFLRPGGLLLVDHEIVHFGNPAYDTASCVNHLLLKAIRFSELREPVLATVEAFWQAYLDGLASADVEEMERETLLQLGCLMLARIDGKSPVEYFVEEADKQRVRSIAKTVLRERPRALAEVVALVRG